VDVAGTQYMQLRNRCRDLNWSLPSMVTTVAFDDEDTYARYNCIIQYRGAVCAMTIGVILV